MTNYVDVVGLYLYMLVVETFSADKIKLRVYALIGWGKSLSISYSQMQISCSPSVGTVRQQTNFN